MGNKSSKLEEGSSKEEVRRGKFEGGEEKFGNIHMKSSIYKIALIVVIIILLPTIIVTVYEISTVRKNDAVIQEIYNNQLEAILSSINQYAEYELSNWAEIISKSLEADFTMNAAIKEKILSGNTPIDQVVFQHEPGKHEPISPPPPAPDHFIQKNQPGEIIIITKQNEKYSDSLKAEIQEIFFDKAENFMKLKRYLKEGYQKLESTIIDIDGQNMVLIYFVFVSETDVLVNAGFLMKPEKFIGEWLDPQIQEKIKDKFYVISFYQTPEHIIYKSEREGSIPEIQFQKELWLLNDHFLGIQLKGETIGDLVRDHLRMNLILIGIINVALIFGIWIILKNVKNQITLAQIKSEFVSNVSHEIRTPLALISMYIETLEMDRVKSEEKKKEYYSIILQESQRLSGIVNRILSFSQIESGKRKYHFAPVNLMEVIGEVHKRYAFHLDSKGFKFQVCSKEDLPVIDADKEALMEALVNLIDNAVKYSDDKKEVILNCGKIAGGVFIEVCDKGIGISSKDQKLIFDKFYRVTSGNLAHKAKGSGLGLTLVKHIVDSHNGEMQIKSELGKGSCFRMIFRA